MKKRVLCLFLCIMMCLSICPTAVSADWYEDAEHCYLCNGWDEGDNICDNCGCHENGICEEWTHCWGCGACFAEIDGDWCTECGLCYECWEDSDEHCILCGEHVGDTCSNCHCCDDCADLWTLHCPECGECLFETELFICPHHSDHCVADGLYCEVCGGCFFDDPDAYCEDCWMCIECAIQAGKHCGICEECADGEICDQCGMCPNCALENEMHCPECGECVNGEFCLEGGEHCQNCCVICDSCKRCVEANGLEICGDCGLCEECCAQLSMDEGCESGEICTASAEWDEHFCENCGICFCAIDPCDDCGLCLECCAEASIDAGCSTGEICVESPEWDAHFCDDCGSCFCEIDWCDYCGLCIDCCEANSACGDGMCLEDPDYGDHFCSVCGQCFHDVDQCAACAGNGDIVCLDCCEHEEHSAPVVNENAPEILRQPKDYVGPASGLSYDINATFTVKLKNPDGAAYQWQKKSNLLDWTDLSEAKGWAYGVNTDTLTTFVDEDSCDPATHYLYRCKITNEYGTTYTDVVETKSVHTYSYDKDEYDEEYHGTMCQTCGLFTDDLEPHKFTAWKVTKEASATETGLRERSCTGCGYKETEVIPKIHVHTFSTTYSKDVHYHWYKCTTSGCAEVSGKALHEFGDLVVTTPATEAAYGSGYRACKICGMKVYEDIAKLPHTHDFIEGTAVYGYTEYDKYETYDDAYHWKICLKKIGTVTCGHVYEKQVHNYGQWTVPSSEDGYMTRTCLTCFYKQERYATEEERSMYQLQTSHAKILINGKANQGDFANAGDTITLIADYSTDTNHVFGGWSVGHYWDDEGHDHPSLDLTDAEKKNPTLTFTMPAHKVDVRATVKVCHHDDVTKQHLDESTAVPASCFTAGKKADLICDICHGVVEEGEMIPAYGDHDYQLDESTVIEATCTKVGFTGNMVCTHCGDTIRGERAAKLEHTYGETEVITAPTCHSLGLEGKICTECGYVLRGDRIERTAHTESDWISDERGHMTKCTDPDCGALIEKMTAHTDEDGNGKCDVCGYSLLDRTVIFEMCGHGTAITKQSVKDGEAVVKPADPIADGFVFKGWYDDPSYPSIYDFDTPVTGELILYAKWDPDLPAITSVAVSDVPTPVVGESCDTSMIRFVSTPADAVILEGAGAADIRWFDETAAAFADADDTFIEGHKYYLSVSVNPKDGHYIPFEWIIYAGTASVNGKPAEHAQMRPEDESYVLWFTGDWEILPVMPDVVVSFDMGGHGAQAEDQIISKGSNAVKPADPTADGWTFGGWYADAACSAAFDFGAAVSANTVVYAKWTENAAAPETPDASDLPFTDVESDSWSADDIAFVWEKGLMKGISDTEFGPGLDTSRAMLVTVLWRLDGMPTVDYEITFADVKADEWYTEAIRWAQANGIVNGYSAEEFGTDDPVIREQMAAIFYRYAQYKGIDVSAESDITAFVDYVDIDAWSEDSVAWAYAVGLVNGVSDSAFDPQGSAKRDQVAAILHRFCDSFGK